MEKSKFIISILIILVLPCARATIAGPKASKHFVLVHGACHGAWSWYKIVPLLRSSGHNATAIDLGASGINPKQVLQVPNLTDYFSPLVELMRSLPADQKVVLVGHSFGGFAISKVMEIFPEKISDAIFVTALMPGPTDNAATIYINASSAAVSQPDNRVTYDNGPTNPPTTFIFGPNFLASNLYQRSPREDLALATLLIRPIYFYTVEDVSTEIVLSKERYGSIRRLFIVATDDKLLSKEFQLSMIAKNPPQQVREILGSDHMTMMSKPLQLFQLVVGFANQ